MACIFGEDLGVPHGVGAPAPEFAALRDVVVGREHGSGVLAVVISGHIVFLLVVYEHGVAHRVSGPPVCLDAVLVFFRSIVGFHGHRPVSHPVLAVELHELGALGEDDLVVLIHSRAHVGPVKQGIVVLGGVHQTSADFHVGNARMQGDADGPLHAVAVFSLTEPDGLAAIAVVHDLPVAGDVRSLTVMMEDVPLHAAADPGSCHTDICGLDTVLMIENVISVGLVYGIEKTSANGGQHAQFDIFVFEIQRLVGDDLALAGHIVVERVGIHAAAGPLVRPVAVEYRSLFRRVQQVGGKVKRTFPGFHALSLSCAAGNGQQCGQNQKSLHICSILYLFRIEAPLGGAVVFFPRPEHSRREAGLIGRIRKMDGLEQHAAVFLHRAVFAGSALECAGCVSKESRFRGPGFHSAAAAALIEVRRLAQGPVPVAHDPACGHSSHYCKMRMGHVKPVIHSVRGAEIERSSFHRKNQVRAHLQIVLDALVSFHLEKMIHDIATFISLEVEEGVVAEVYHRRLVGSGFIFHLDSIVFCKPISYIAVAVAGETALPVRAEAMEAHSNPVVFL